MLDREPMMLTPDRRLAFTRRRSASTEDIRLLWHDEIKFAEDAIIRDALALDDASRKQK